VAGFLCLNVRKPSLAFWRSQEVLGTDLSFKDMSLPYFMATPNSDGKKNPNKQNKGTSEII